MNANDTMVVRELSESYRLQLSLYQALDDNVHKILSRMILSRGDLRSVRGDFDEKKRLLERIEAERLKSLPHISVWQARKSHLADNSDVQELDDILQKIEGAIKRFLEGEEQLKRHLECLMRTKG